MHTTVSTGAENAIWKGTRCLWRVPFFGGSTITLATPPESRRAGGDAGGLKFSVRRRSGSTGRERNETVSDKGRASLLCDLEPLAIRRHLAQYLSSWYWDRP